MFLLPSPKEAILPLLNCPDSEKLFEFVTIPSEISNFRRAGMKLHAVTCAPCRIKMESIQKKWSSYFQPEPEVTSSLMKVYSKLQNDETLILRGWKLGEQRNSRRNWVGEGWVFRGAVAVGVASIFGAVFVSQVRNNEKLPGIISSASSSFVPYAQIRVEDKNRIQVQYVKPELLESMEFQTTDSPTRPVSTGDFNEGLR
jgi:hypothetical protein